MKEIQAKLREIKALAEGRARKADCLERKAADLMHNYNSLMKTSDTQLRIYSANSKWKLHTRYALSDQVYLPIVREAITERKLPKGISAEEFEKLMAFNLGPGLTALLYDSIDEDCQSMGYFRYNLKSNLQKGTVPQNVAEDVSQVYVLTKHSCKCSWADIFGTLFGVSNDAVRGYLDAIDVLAQKEKGELNVRRVCLPENTAFDPRNIRIAEYLNAYGNTLTEVFPVDCKAVKDQGLGKLLQEVKRVLSPEYSI